MATKKITDTRDLIVKHLEEIKRPLAWIADPNTDIPYGTIYSTFKHKAMDLTKERLDKINKWLNTNFSLNGTD